MVVLWYGKTKELSKDTRDKLVKSVDPSSVAIMEQLKEAFLYHQKSFCSQKIIKK